MLANDYEFMVYGGYLNYGDKDPSIGANWCLARDMIQNGATPLSDPGRFRQLALSGVSRYIAAGASVNVPSENKGFVFSGATVSYLFPFSPAFRSILLKRFPTNRVLTGDHFTRRQRPMIKMSMHTIIAQVSYPWI